MRGGTRSTAARSTVLRVWFAGVLVAALAGGCEPETVAPAAASGGSRTARPRATSVPPAVRITPALPDARIASAEASPPLPATDASTVEPSATPTLPTADENTAEPSLPTTAPSPTADTAADPDPLPIWTPRPGTTWQWQLTGDVDTSVEVEVYDIDLFTNPPELIESLHADGRAVICYFSAGTYEPDRPDSAALASTGLGHVLDGWPDERWLDIRSQEVREIMQGRLDLAWSQGCDGVEPDNVDAFDNDNGLDLTAHDQIEFNAFLAAEAHARGLSIGLKNTLALIPDLADSFDWALNEECLQYDECERLEPFLAAGKAVFHCEYIESSTSDESELCASAPAGFSSIVKNLDLDAPLVSCN